MRGLMRRTAVVAGAVAVMLCLTIEVPAAQGAFPPGGATASAPVAVPLFAYVTNTGSDKVSVVNTATNTITRTISVGAAPLGVAVTPDGDFAYVTNSRSNTVSVIDTATRTVTATIHVGTAPLGVAVTPGGGHAYVTDNRSNTVSVIDTATNTVTATIHVGTGPWGIAVTPDGKRVYVTNTLSNTVSVIDTATNSVTATIPGFSAPWGVAAGPDGGYADVANALSNTASVMDASASKVAAVPVGSFPYGVAVTPDGKRVYVTSTFSNTVSVIDTATNSVVATVAVGRHPHGVAVTPDGTRVYVTNTLSNTVSVIDTATNKVATIRGFTTPEGVALPAAVTPRVFAGYTDSTRPGRSHPDLWQGSPDVIFKGCNYFTPTRCHKFANGFDVYDGGALRLDNPTAQAMTVTSASVTVRSRTLDPWPGLHVTVPGREMLILTQTGQEYFDISDTNHTSNVCSNDKIIPVIRVTVDGRVLTYKDTRQTLNDGGTDPGNTACGSRNETRNWAPVSLSSP